MISIPFSGGKKFSYKDVKKIVSENDYNLVLEPFGGSCVLSVNLYNDKLVDEVIVNDYDGIFDIYEEYLDIKDWIVNTCYDHGFLRNVHGSGKRESTLRDRDDNIIKVAKQTPLPQEKREFLQSLISQVDKKYWRLLSWGSNFTFSGVGARKISLKDFAYFNSYLKTDRQRNYLKVIREIERDTLDYADFLEKHKDKITDKTLIIIDPPYSGTYQTQYKEVFDDEKTIKLIETLNSLGCDYIFFNADKEKMTDWLEGTNFEIQQSGCQNQSILRNRKEYLAYVKAPKEGVFFNAQE